MQSFPVLCKLGKGGSFCEDNAIPGKWPGGDPELPGYAEYVDPKKSKDTAKKLWELSEKLTEFNFS